MIVGRLWLIALVCCFASIATTASAGPRKLLVLRADSSADWETRSSIESGVLGLARNVDRHANLTDSSFKDISAMLGCVGDAAKCKGAVIDSLAITEAVLITITPAGDASVKVTVQRASRAGIRAHTAVIAKDDPRRALAAQFGPLFGSSKMIEPPPAPKRSTPPKGNVAFGGAVSVTQPDPEPTPPPRAPPPPPVDDEVPPPPARNEPAAPPPVVVAEPASSEPAATPIAVSSTSEPVDGGPRDWRRPAGYAGLAAGTALVVVGVVLWRSASSIEDDILASPNRTPADVARLLDLEERGDRDARWGNITFIGGLAIAGAGGYLLWRVRRDRSSTASVTPLVLDGGGGVAVHWEVP